MSKLFFLLSGEHPTLPTSELLSILEAEKKKFKLVEKLDQVVRIEADVDCVVSIRRRAAMVRRCCLELFSCEAEYTEILSKASETPFEEYLSDDENIAVRVRRVRKSAPTLDRLRLERDLGAAIVKRRKVKVDLRNPDKTFFGVITENRFVFGVSLAEILGGEFASRNPMKKPFFHPTGLPAKLARCMVNLARPGKGDLLADPFCGTGSILIEAGLIGCRVLGLDVSKKMVKGTRENLKFYGLDCEGLIVSDSRRLPISKADCIVTDPPYGRSSSTLGSTTKEIVEVFLCEALKVLPRGGKICIASPVKVEVSRLGRALGFRLLESHTLYVHKSLTREIAVLEAA
ncbi:methyltransferase [Candidatus Bathyarchaeota archaeon]|nr:methyltransferase [Candidatus Bathyarchaeota archaeon]